MILSEHLTYNNAKVIVESGNETEGDGRKKLFLSGIFVQGGIRNLNGRIYPVSEIKNAVEHINQQIADDMPILSEVDHPQNLSVNIDRVCGNIEKMWLSGSDGYGRMRILNTPMGTLVRTLIESDIRLGVSSRGSGEVDENTGQVSQFEIVTVDVVCRPSAAGAVPKAVFEAKNSHRGNIITDLSEAVLHDPKAQRYLTEELLSWINNLK